MLMFGWDFEVSVVEIMKQKFDQDLCLNLWYDPLGYFGKMNSTLGSVVPLAMFYNISYIIGVNESQSERDLDSIHNCLWCCKSCSYQESWSAKWTHQHQHHEQWHEPVLSAQFMTACGNNQWSVSASWKMISRFSTCIVSTVHDRPNQARIRISIMKTLAPATSIIISTCIVSTVHDRPNRASQRDPELGSSGSSTSCKRSPSVWSDFRRSCICLPLVWSDFRRVCIFFLEIFFFYEGHWVWCTLDTPDATTHLRLYVALDKTKDLQFRKFKFLLSWTNF